MIYMFEVYDILGHADEVKSMILLRIFLYSGDCSVPL